MVVVGMSIEVTLDQIAKAIHESRTGNSRWEVVPESELNPQRASALRAAGAVVKTFAPATKSPQEAAKNVQRILTAEEFKGLVSETSTLIKRWRIELLDNTDMTRVVVEISDEDEEFALKRALAKVLRPSSYVPTVTEVL